MQRFQFLFKNPYRDIQNRIVYVIQQDSDCWEKHLTPEDQKDNYGYSIFRSSKKHDEFVISYIYNYSIKKLNFKITTSGEIIFTESAANQFFILWELYPRLISGLIMAGYRVMSDSQFFPQLTSPNLKILVKLTG